MEVSEVDAAKNVESPCIRKKTALFSLLFISSVLIAAAILAYFVSRSSSPDCGQVLGPMIVEEKEHFGPGSFGGVPAHNGGETGGEYCDDMLSGLQIMRRGVDLSQLDFVPVGENKERGFKSALFDYSCEQGQTFDVDGKKFQIPDQVTNVSPRTGGELNSDVNVYQSTKEVLKKWGVTAGLGVSFPLGSFSASSSYESVSRSLTTSSTSVAEVKLQEFVREAVLKEGYNLKLSNDARTFIGCLPGKFDRSSAGHYQNFIAKFGTHYLHKADFGGALRFVLATSLASGEKMNSQSLSVSAEAEVNYMMVGVKATAGMTKEDKEKMESFRKRTTKKINYVGGDTNLINDNGTKTWQPSVRLNPALIGGNVRPVYELVEEAGKRQSFVEAIRVHLDKSLMRACIGDLKAINVTGRATQNLSDRAVKLTSELTTLVNKSIPDHRLVAEKVSRVEELIKQRDV